MAGQPRIVGVDLGTTNTCVAYVRNRLARVVPTPRGNLILPSIVARTAAGELVVGAAARDQLVVNPKDTIVGAKRLIGRPWDSPAVQELRRFFPYEVVPGPSGEAAVKLGETVHSLPQISGLLLAHARSIAEQSLGGPIAEAVITVPAYYNDAQRAAVKEAGRLAGFEVRRIVNEPTAAALAYGFNRGLDQRILVYDLGGGTFDVSVLQVTGNVFEVVATGGDTFLGGADFDARITEHVLAEFLRQEKIDLLQSGPVAVQRVRAAAEAAKIELSLIQSTTIELPYVEQRRGKPVDLRVSLTRDRLDAITADLVARTFDLCDAVLAQKGLRPRDIDEVILVGGQSRMPLVQRRIQEHFGKPARKGVHPDECVALGAALLADSLDHVDAVTLIDALSMPIGMGMPGGRIRELVPRGARIPLTKPFRLPAPRDGAPEIELELYQGGTDRILESELLGVVRVPASLAGRRFELRLTEECLLEVLVELPGEGLCKASLATRDTPALLRQARAEEEARLRREAEAAGDAAAGEGRGGLLGSLRRVFGRS